MFKIGKFQEISVEFQGGGVREKMLWNSRGVVKNEIEFLGGGGGGMNSENGYPQQGGYEKFLEKPNQNS